MTFSTNKNTISQKVYKASITREPFLFYEMRTTAKLMYEGISHDEAVNRIVEGNLFQYPTEKSVRRMATACVRRLQSMGDNSLIEAVATQSVYVSRQICLYAMMKEHRLVWDFMVTVIGEKYRLNDFSYGRIDLNSFFLRLQEQNDEVAVWSDSTVVKIKQVLNKILVDNEYIDSTDSNRLNPVCIEPVLENAIHLNNDDVILPAFNCFL
ncbi:MAG: DUF1819 family protein [Oscillospiraceae bacterium]